MHSFVITGLLVIGTQSGCWKYNLSGMHSEMTPKQIYNQIHPPIAFGDSSEAVLDEMADFYVMRMDDVYADNGERAAVYWLRPPGWSYRGPGKHLPWGVGEPVNFVFDAEDMFVAVSIRNAFFPESNYRATKVSSRCNGQHREAGER
ncbi:MAG: hypothetical protein Phyf2KO_14810 [Phycisphaerales bacterium]